jgi:hypothetical protein
MAILYCRVTVCVVAKVHQLRNIGAIDFLMLGCNEEARNAHQLQIASLHDGLLQSPEVEAAGAVL